MHVHVYNYLSTIETTNPYIFIQITHVLYWTLVMGDTPNFYSIRYRSILPKYRAYRYVFRFDIDHTSNFYHKKKFANKTKTLKTDRSCFTVVQE